MTNDIRLYVKGVSEIMGNEKIGLIILTDLSGKQISIVCEWHTAQEINKRLKKSIDISLSLPEVMSRMIPRRKGYMYNYYVKIAEVEDEQYKTYIISDEIDEVYKIKASDAILMSLVMCLPIFIDPVLMRRQAISSINTYDKASIPINVVKTSILEETLERAINDEDYETASKIHSELERRKQEKKGRGKDTDAYL